MIERNPGDKVKHRGKCYILKSLFGSCLKKRTIVMKASESKPSCEISGCRSWNCIPCDKNAEFEIVISECQMEKNDEAN